MQSKKNGLILFTKEHPFYNSLAQDSVLKAFANWTLQSQEAMETKVLKEILLSYDYSILSDLHTIEAHKSIHHRSVGSHFLKYIDLVVNEGGKLWGYSAFSEVFREVLLRSIQNQDYKGSVIFLGQSPLALPVIDVLASFGFEDFVFLQLAADRSIQKFMDRELSGLWGVEVSTVDSAAFIQSQKEYSFCFVMEPEYPLQTLEDMSYFHFLSTNSLVFDLVGESNFLFQEVEALGVEVMKFKGIRELWVKILGHKLDEIASKMSKKP